MSHTPSLYVLSFLTDAELSAFSDPIQSGDLAYSAQSNILYRYSSTPAVDPAPVSAYKSSALGGTWIPAGIYAFPAAADGQPIAPVRTPNIPSGLFMRDDGTWAAPVGGGFTPGGTDQEMMLGNGGVATAMVMTWTMSGTSLTTVRAGALLGATAIQPDGVLPQITMADGTKSVLDTNAAYVTTAAVSPVAVSQANADKRVLIFTGSNIATITYDFTGLTLTEGQSWTFVNMVTSSAPIIIKRNLNQIIVPALHSVTATYFTAQDLMVATVPYTGSTTTYLNANGGWTTPPGTSTNYLVQSSTSNTQVLVTAASTDPVTSWTAGITSAAFTKTGAIGATRVEVRCSGTFYGFAPTGTANAFAYLVLQYSSDAGATWSNLAGSNQALTVYNVMADSKDWSQMFALSAVGFLTAAAGTYQFRLACAKFNTAGVVWYLLATGGANDYFTLTMQEVAI